jgi:hypothetical protein
MATVDLHFVPPFRLTTYHQPPIQATTKLSGNSMDEDGVRRLLRREIKRAGGQAAFARDKEITEDVVNVMLRGRPPGPTLLAALELEKLPTQYRRRKGAAK